MADNVIVLNVPELARLLQAAPVDTIAQLRVAVERWQLRRVADLARYPAPPPGSGYIRTGTLGRTWTAARPTWSASASGFESKLGNVTPYATFVQGQRQARVHQGRWRKADEAAQQAQPELERDIQGAIAQVEAQINGTAS